MDPTAAVPLETLPVARARERVRAEALAAAGPRVAMERVEELRLDLPGGPRRGRLYVPGTRFCGDALLLFFHGGGFALGDLDTHDDCCRLLADAAGVRVLAPDYALAPQDPFPAAPEDALAAFGWALAESERLAIDPRRVAVGGDSAGGNLAAVVAAEAAGCESPPAMQLLIYPWLDLAAAEGEGSRRRYGAGFGLTNSELAWYRDLYLGAAAGAVTAPRCSPLHRAALAGLPPAWIATAGNDPLRDDGERYAARLAAAGVEVVLRRHPGLLHGYVEALGRDPGGRAATLEAAAGLRDRLAR